MKLLTLNCHSWQENNQLDKIMYLAKTIVKNDYDVITLQEVSQKVSSGLKIANDNFVKILVNNLEKISDKKYDYFWDTAHIGYDTYYEGVAVVTKHNIRNATSFYVSKSEDLKDYKARKIVKASINIEGVKYDFYSCHLGWWKDENEHFTEQVNKLLDKIDNKNSFLMGDFNNNAFVRNEGYDFIIDKGLIDTYSIAINKDSGITVPGEIDGWHECKEEKRLDLILTTSKLTVKSSKVIFNGKNKDIVSDHFGVEIEI